MSLILGLDQITLNPLLSPPSQISPLPLISPPFQGKKVNKPPIVLVLFGVRVRHHSDRAAATWPLPLFDSANVRHCQEKLLRSKSLVAMSTWRHTSLYSHICQHFSCDESLRKQPTFRATTVGCFLRLVVMWRNVTCRLYQLRNHVGYRLCCEN